jgi:hypothetical protein
MIIMIQMWSEKRVSKTEAFGAVRSSFVATGSNRNPVSCQAQQKFLAFVFQKLILRGRSSTSMSLSLSADMVILLSLW